VARPRRRNDSVAVQPVFMQFEPGRLLRPPSLRRKVPSRSVPHEAHMINF